MLEIIIYWSDKLSGILYYFTFGPHQKKYVTSSAQKSGVICLSRPRIPARPRVPKSSRTTSPSPRVPTSPSPHVPVSPSPTSHVPLLVTALSFCLSALLVLNGSESEKIIDRKEPMKLYKNSIHAGLYLQKEEQGKDVCKSIYM